MSVIDLFQTKVGEDGFLMVNMKLNLIALYVNIFKTLIRLIWVGESVLRMRHASKMKKKVEHFYQ